MVCFGRGKIKREELREMVPGYYYKDRDPKYNLSMVMLLTLGA